MCGIVGTFRFDGQDVSSPLLQAQVEHMHHRGPDGSGIWTQGHVGLGHVRLTIIDLSEQGSQPMVSPDGRFILTYNGEVYNYLDLKQKFSSPYEYTGTSDTEVLRNGLSAKGASFINSMEGMFAFAFYDVLKDELLIARDPFGIKPLYYYQDENQIAFASEIEVLLKDASIKTGINYDALKEYFILGYSLDPHTSFQNIKRLEPGRYMRVSKVGVKTEKYFGVDELFIQGSSDTGNWLNVFEESIRLHAIADVPIGAFLSGGMDSTLIINALKKQGLLDRNFRAYNAGKDGNGKGGVYWERKVAIQSAEYYGIDLIKIDSNEDKFMPFESVINTVEEPICNPSNYLIDKICATAKANNQKVLLSGHGGDEIFAGYRRHLVARYLGDIRKFGMGRFLLMLHRVRPNNILYRIGTAGLSSNTHPLLSLVGIGLSLTSKHNSLTNWVTKDDLQKMAEKLYTFIPEGNNLTYLKQVMSLEFGTYLASQNLLNMDKFSMKHSVEVRVPFLYRPLVSMGLNMPDSKLIKGKKTKSILRETGGRILPEFIVDKPKSGFAPSQSDLIQKDEIKSLVMNKTIDEHGLFSSSRIEKQFYSGDKVTETQALQLMNIATIEAWVNKYKSVL